MNKNSIFIIVTAAFILLAASFYSIYQLDPGNKPSPSVNVSTKGDPQIGGAFSLVDTEGNLVNNESLKGKISFLYFGFANCPDTCPMTLQTIAGFLNSINPAELNLVQPYFISIDPSRDTNSLLKEFTSNFHEKIIPLTGTKEQIDQAKNAFKIYAKEDKKDEKGDYNINHTSIIYVMDKNAKYVGHFSPKSSNQEIKSIFDKAKN